MTIFVTVGTTEFDALVQAVDELALSLNEDVVVQIGRGAYEPRHCRFFRFASDLAPYYRDADLVIAHGGLGTTMEVLRLGVPLVSISNPDRYDRHQADLLAELSARGYLLWCRNLADLEQSVIAARSNTLRPYELPDCRIHEVIRGYLDRAATVRSSAGSTASDS